MKELTRILLCGLLAGSVASGCVVKTSDADDGDSAADDGAAGDDTGDDGAAGSADGAAGGGGSSGDDGSAGDDGTAGSTGDDSEEVTVTTLDCGDRDVTDALVVDGDVREDVTWSGTVYVKSAIDIYEGATVTIEPGTDVIVAAGAELDFGWNSQAATLKAEGTAEQPIRFCGESGDQGYWNGLFIQRNVTTDSVLANVLIADAGADGAALRIANPVLITDVQVKNSGDDGVLASGFKSGSTGLSVMGAKAFAVVCDNAEAVDTFPLGGSFMDNGDSLVLLDYADVRTDVTFHKLPIPYLQKVSVDVYEEAVVTMEAGVQYQFGADADLELGWNSQAAELRVEGTEEDPVVFSGQSTESAFWAGIVIGRNVVSSSVIRHAVVRHGGADGKYALHIEAPLTLDHVTLEDNEHGVYISEVGVKSGSGHLTVTGTADVPLTTEPNGMLALPLGGSFMGNTEDYVLVNGGDLEDSGTIPALDVPFAIGGSIDQYSGADVVIEPGTTLRMKVDVRWLVGWNSQAASLQAEGTADAPIKFVGFTEEKGHWAALEFGRNATSESVLDYVEVSHGGGQTSAAILLNRPIAISNTKVSMSESAGIGYQSDDTTDYTASGNTFEDNDGGAVTAL